MSMFQRPVVRAEMAKLARDGFRRVCWSLGEVRDIEHARDLARERAPQESQHLGDGDWLGFRTYIDYGDQYAWLGLDSQFRFDQAWEAITAP